MSSYTVGLSLVLLGALLLYAAWTKRSVRRLILGDASPATGGYS